jgi:hypothetical protein
VTAFASPRPSGRAGHLSAAEIARIRELRYEDGLTLVETAREVGCSVFTVQRHAPGRPGKINNAKLREAFERSGKSAADVARAIGWWADVDADVSRVRRTLGLRTDIDGRGHKSNRRLIDAETAGRLAEAIGVMPWEVGA